MTTQQQPAADLSTLTPREIDEMLASLYDTYWAACDARARAWQSVHYAAGDKQVSRRGWRMTNEQAFAAAQDKRDAAAGRPRRVDEIQKALDAISQRNEQVTDALAATQPYQREYARRPWTRFFLVEDGHIHSSMSCSTCNKGNEPTRFGWLPELSGKTMADAIAHFESKGKNRSEVLCSVCYPDAPREWMVRPVDPNQCPGSGTTDYDPTAKSTRRGYAAGNGAVCTHCGEYRAVSSRGFGKLIKHKA